MFNENQYRSGQTSNLRDTFQNRIEDVVVEMDDENLMTQENETSLKGMDEATKRQG